MSARFCIAETGLPLLGDACDEEAVSQRLEELLALIGCCWREQQEVCRWSKLEYVEIVPGVCLADLMYQPQRLDRVLQLALQETLNRCRLWDGNDDAVEPTVELLVDDEEEDAPSAVWACAEQESGRAVACLSISPCDSGQRRVQVAGKSWRVFFLCQSECSCRREFYRTIPTIEDLDEDKYLAAAPLMFPTLYFKPDIGREFRRFAGGYRAVREEVTRHLAILSDHFLRIFGSQHQQLEPTLKELRACGLDVSGESPSTKSNKDAWKQRKITIAGQDLYCELHLKLEPTKNRIHFHPGQPDIADGKVIIGIFHEHLPT
jgi:hypothetical protein